MAMQRGYGSRKVAVGAAHEGANPITGLAWELRQTAGNIEYLTDELEQLTGEEIVWGRTHLTVKRTLADELADVLGTVRELPRISRNEDSWWQTNHEAVLNVWVQLYLKERRHYLELLKLAISSGLENRRINILEEHVLQFNDVLGNIISRLGADPEDPSIRRMVQEELTKLLPRRQEISA